MRAECEPIIDCVARSMSWPDTTFAWASAVGVQVVGRQEKIGIFKASQKEAALTEESLLESASLWHDELVSAPRPSALEIDAIWLQSVKEQVLKNLGPWRTRDQMVKQYGANSYRAMRRFAIPVFITAVALRWLGLPMTHFFDDFKVTAPAKNSSAS